MQRNLLLYTTLMNDLLNVTSNYIHLLSAHLLVLASSLLTRLELVKVPSANGKGTLVLVHALAKVADVVCACCRGSLVLRSRVGVVVCLKLA